MHQAICFRAILQLHSDEGAEGRGASHNTGEPFLGTKQDGGDRSCHNGWWMVDGGLPGWTAGWLNFVGLEAPIQPLVWPGKSNQEKPACLMVKPWLTPGDFPTKSVNQSSGKYMKVWCLKGLWFPWIFGVSRNQHRRLRRKVLCPVSYFTTNQEINHLKHQK